VRALREVWAACVPGLDLDRLVFLDECGVNTAMFRRHGRCPRGQRLVDAQPAGHRQNNTLLAGVRLDGVVAPMVLDGPVNGESFAGYVERSLVPELRPGDVVVMDSLPAHKGPRVAAAIEGAGCRLAYLPPYSPDLSPIEPMWSKVKSRVRGAAARTLEALVDAVGAALLCVTPEDCESYFEHCGYDATPT
jgi:transposase